MRLAALLVAASALVAQAPAVRADATKTDAKVDAKPEPKKAEVKLDDPLAKYFEALAQMKLVDVDSGNITTLRRELQVGENLLHDGAFTAAAVALFGIVKSPRYAAFTEFVEFQNAEYDLAVALARAGAYGAALDAIDQIQRRGPGAAYWGPAHRRAVDIALETRDHAGVLARLEQATAGASDPIPPAAAGERAYLRARVAYDQGKFADAEGELVQITKKSRMYTSALYLRGVIRARRGELKGSAEALCEIAATPDTDRYAFVVDDRYFTLKDLARLGLGRLAHEQGDYDDAYYHYFQIPDDSSYLPDALFEASWSMYQKRELATSRDLVKELLQTFPTSPTWPEASLLAGYVELADCKFDDSQAWYDKLVARLQPIVDEMDKIKRDPQLRRTLFARAITRYRGLKYEDPATAKVKASQAPTTVDDEVLALLRLDPKFLRLDDAVTGMHELAANAPAVARVWQNLGAQVSEKHVAAVSTARTLEEEQLADASAVVEDLRRLVADVARQRQELAAARAAGTLDAADATAEDQRLDALAQKTRATLERAVAAADHAASAVGAASHATIRPLLVADLADARRLDRQAHALEQQLAAAGDKLAEQAMQRLYDDTRRVLDKAKLGKIDAIIGQKRKLDIEVQDLAAGRFPEELIGKLWNASMIGDDEEYWPWQGEYWSDEYEGWR